MSTVTFYILGALMIAGAAVSVGAPRMREGALGLIGFSLVAAILFAAAGAWLTAAVELAVPVVGTGVVLWLLRRGGYRGMARPAPLVPRLWWLGLGVALCFGALLITVFALSGNGWFRGTGMAALVTVLHYREPYTLVLAAVLAISGIAVALLLGRTGDDERRADAVQASRRGREERSRARREARASARRARREAPATGGGGA